MNSTSMSETTTESTAANTAAMREYTETTENTQEELNMETEGQPQMEQNGGNGTDDESGMWDMLDDMMSPPTRGHPGGRGCPIGPRGRPFMGRGGGRGRGFGMGPPWARMPMGPRGPHGMGLNNGFGPGAKTQRPGCGFGMGPRWSGYEQYSGQMAGPMGFWNHPHSAYSAPFAHGPWQAWSQGSPHFNPGTWESPQAHGPPGIPLRLLHRIRRLAAQMEDKSSSSDSETECQDENKADEAKAKGPHKGDRPSVGRGPMAHPMKGMKGPVGMGPGLQGMYCRPEGVMIRPMGWGGRPHGPPMYGRPIVPPRLIQRLRRLVAAMEQEQQDSNDNQTEKPDHEDSQDRRKARRQAFLQRLNAWLGPASENQVPCPRPGRGMCCGPPGMQRHRFLRRLRRLAAEMEDDSNISESEDDVQKTTDTTTEQNDKKTTESKGDGKPQAGEATKDERRRAKRKARMEHLMAALNGSDRMGMCRGRPHMGLGPMGMGPGPRGGMGWFGHSHGPPMQGRPVIPRPLLQRLRRLVTAMENKGQHDTEDNNDKTDATLNDESQARRRTRRVARLQRLLESLDSASESDVRHPHYWRRMAMQGPPGPGPHRPLRRMLKKIFKAQELKNQSQSSRPRQDDPAECGATTQEEDHLVTDSELMDECTELCDEVETIDLGPEVIVPTESEPQMCPTCNCARTK